MTPPSGNAKHILSGGPAGIIYGYILVWIGTLSTFATLSELTSMCARRMSPFECFKLMKYKGANLWRSISLGFYAFTAEHAKVLELHYRSALL